MKNKSRVMILAAGFGTRLKPYSLLRPKPLFPLLDVPLIGHILDQLKHAGFGPVLVNSHHLKEQLTDFIGNRDGVSLQQELSVLGTGGGLRMAQDFLGNDPVLVVNGDIYHTIDLASVYEAHCVSGARVTLVLHDYQRFNRVSLDDQGGVRAFGEDDGAKKLAFTGIHVLNPEILSVIPPGSFYDILDCYRYWISQGEPIQALVVRDHFWKDMGTPEDYLDLHRVLLTEKSFCRKSPFYVGRNVHIPDDLTFEGWFSIGSNAKIGRGCHLKRVVVWDGAVVPDGVNISDAIIT